MPVAARESRQARAGVLGIHVDGIATDRAERDLRRPEAQPAVGREAARLEKLREHLAEQVGLAERLRADPDRSPAIRACRDPRLGGGR
jgi:hypothetical protein